MEKNGFLTATKSALLVLLLSIDHKLLIKGLSMLLMHNAHRTKERSERDISRERNGGGDMKFGLQFGKSYANISVWLIN